VPAGVFDRALPGELRGAGDCVREAVAVSSEGGAVEEGEVEAGEAVHGLPQEGGGQIKRPKWARTTCQTHQVVDIVICARNG